MYKIRSRLNVGKNPKRHFIDPSLGCAVLNITPEKLINDLETMGFYFEALCERDLKIYMPDLKLCTDNGAMIAAAGYYNYLAGDVSDLSLNAIPNLKL